MLNQMFLATLMAVLITVVHLTGLGILVRALQLRERLFSGLRILPLILLFAATVGIFLIHALEIALYALVFTKLHAFSTFEAAFYFSVVTYTTIGYGDLLMPHQWRIFGASEGPVGVVMMGWSTAFLISLLTQLKLLGDDWLALPRDDPSPARDAKP